MLSLPGLAKAVERWKGLRKVRSSSQRLDLPPKLIKHCHNRANKGLRKLERLGFPLGASLACMRLHMYQLITMHLNVILTSIFVHPPSQNNVPNTSNYIKMPLYDVRLDGACLSCICLNTIPPRGRQREIEQERGRERKRKRSKLQTCKIFLP